MREEGVGTLNVTGRLVAADTSKAEVLFQTRPVQLLQFVSEFKEGRKDQQEVRRETGNACSVHKSPWDLTGCTQRCCAS